MTTAQVAITMETEKKYIHGYSEVEQDRLRRQAELTEFVIYQDVNFSQTENLLEVGCGVGAQTQILLRRFPRLRITCIDINDEQLQAARTGLGALDFARDRYKIQKMNAEKLTFPEDSFDGAFICWVMEHMPNPARVLSEVRRVLRPGSRIVISEVMNFSYFLDPYCPAIWKFWMAFNDYQYDRSGDPFIGVKLGNFLRDTGYTDVRTHVKLMYADKREPELRDKLLRDREELMMSAVEELLSAGQVDKELVEEMKREFQSVKKNPDAITYDSFMQATARVP